ncbi:hypothetical protein K440DRAFT_67687 [Wilcoxina mikolae CBS 423.85]|nr:hypothetical protein K440DRAFT_67687 [Wilcoxina mikolae CBS 423.85]
MKAKDCEGRRARLCKSQHPDMPLVRCRDLTRTTTCTRQESKDRGSYLLSNLLLNSHLNNFPTSIRWNKISISSRLCRASLSKPQHHLDMHGISGCLGLIWTTKCTRQAWTLYVRLARNPPILLSLHSLGFLILDFPGLFALYLWVPLPCGDPTFAAAPLPSLSPAQGHTSALWFYGTEVRDGDRKVVWCRCNEAEHEPRLLASGQETWIGKGGIVFGSTKPKLKMEMGRWFGPATSVSTKIPISGYPKTMNPVFPWMDQELSPADGFLAAGLVEALLTIHNLYSRRESARKI